MSNTHSFSAAFLIAALVLVIGVASFVPLLGRTSPCRDRARQPEPDASGAAGSQPDEQPLHRIHPADVDMSLVIAAFLARRQPEASTHV
jgi:hypothetical protein